MREKHRLEDRIDLLGHVKPDDVPSVRSFHADILAYLRLTTYPGPQSRGDIPKHFLDRIIRYSDRRSCVFGIIRRIN